MYAWFDRGGFRVTGGQEDFANLALARRRWALLRDERQHGANRRTAARAKTHGPGQNTRRHAHRSGKIYPSRNCRIAHAGSDRIRCQAVRFCAELMSASAGTKMRSFLSTHHSKLITHFRAHGGWRGDWNRRVPSFFALISR